jgi:hypothetical protein
MNWWFEQDEVGPAVMADHILFVLGHGLPSSPRRLEKGISLHPRPVAEN